MERRSAKASASKSSFLEQVAILKAMLGWISVGRRFLRVAFGKDNPQKRRKRRGGLFCKWIIVPLGDQILD